MSDGTAPTNGRQGRVFFDPTINLGHVLTALTFLITATAGYVALDYRVGALERSQQEEKTSRRDSDVGIETRVMTRINDERTRHDQTQVRVADDIREIKTIMRDGFRDLDQKLERKADKRP